MAQKPNLYADLWHAFERHIMTVAENLEGGGY